MVKVNLPQWLAPSLLLSQWLCCPNQDFNTPLQSRWRETLNEGVDAPGITAMGGWVVLGIIAAHAALARAPEDAELALRRAAL